MKSAAIITATVLAVSLVFAAESFADDGAAFEKIEVVQTGGFAGVNIMYVVEGDGSFRMKSNRREAKGRLDDKPLAALNEALSDVDWKSIPSKLRTSGVADDFIYQIAVTVRGKTYNFQSDGITAQKHAPLKAITKTLGEIQRAK